ncbi:MAG: hypothetical protein HYW28_03660 [Rhodospirillales bacterium]|nr:hypothetical protein [Rhodospirillales bacterium]MBI2584957.1 hypothetical protein [Rhodospirillales bacterium]
MALFIAACASFGDKSAFLADGGIYPESLDVHTPLDSPVQNNIPAVETPARLATTATIILSIHDILSTVGSADACCCRQVFEQCSTDFRWPPIADQF